MVFCPGVAVLVVYNLGFALAKVILYNIQLTSIGGRTSARRNPTRIILGNQAIKQEANAYINTKQ
jgi:hypothetical protein